MDNLAYANYVLKSNKADMLINIIVPMVREEHPGYSQRQCLLFAKLHHLITDEEWNLIKEIYG